MTEESSEGAMDAARAALKEHFGYDGFRPGQETLVGASRFATKYQVWCCRA